MIFEGGHFSGAKQMTHNSARDMNESKQLAKNLMLSFDDQCRIVKSALVFGSNPLGVYGQLVSILFKVSVKAVCDPPIYPAFHRTTQWGLRDQIDAYQHK